MISIGEFAYSTGLSIKTLRYYHDIGLLPAAEVDPFNGYRSYRAAQMKDAAMLRVLRASGMSIAQMKQALTHPNELPEILEQRAQEMKAQREIEDWALTEAPHWQDPIDLSGVQTRECEQRFWVGVASVQDLKELEDELDDSAFSGLQADFEKVMGALTAAAAFPQQPDADQEPSFWMNLHAERNRPSVVEVAYCVDLPAPLPDGFTVAGVQLVSGVLPERTEAFVTMTMGAEEAAALEDGDDIASRLPGGTLPPRAAIALAQAAEDAGVASTPVRQRAVTTEEGITLELSLTTSS